MDRHLFLRWALITALLVTYTQLFVPHMRTQLTQQEAKVQPVPSVPTITTEVEAKEAYGIFANALGGKEQEVVLENELIKVILTSRGARVKRVMLKKYKDHEQNILTLLDEKSSLMGLQFQKAGEPIDVHALCFKHITVLKDPKAKDAQTTVIFTLPIAKGRYIQQRFTLKKHNYTLTHTWKVVGLSELLDTTSGRLIWKNLVKRTETDLEACRNRTTVNFYTEARKFGHLNERAVKAVHKYLTKPMRWVSIKQRFFTVGIVPSKAFSKGVATTIPTPESTSTVKAAEVYLSLDNFSTSNGHEGECTLYFGPNDHTTMCKVAEGFSRNVTLGWSVVRFTNRFMILPIFSLLERYISNYGIIIVLLVLFIKLMLFPLSYRSYHAMAKMRLLQPALETIRKKHGNNLKRLQMEQLKLYQEMKLNPLSGFVPLLLQMPILLAMFTFFPNTIALRQQAFLWAHDLSTYDAVLKLPFSLPAYGNHVSLFTLLMTVSTLLYTWSSNQANAPQGAMKMLTYIMPLMLLCILNRFPAGLTFYYFVSNVTTFIQQYYIRQFVDEQAITKQWEQSSFNKPSTIKKRLAKIARVTKQ